MCIAANAPRRRFSRRRALLAMIGITGKQYGWVNLGRAALLHLPVFRFLVRPDTNDSEISAWPPFCSQAVAMADRAGGIDPVPNLADRLTEPGDLARSKFFQYRFTLGGGEGETARTFNVEHRRPFAGTSPSVSLSPLCSNADQ